MTKPRGRPAKNGCLTRRGRRPEGGKATSEGSAPDTNLKYDVASKRARSEASVSPIGDEGTPDPRSEEGSAPKKIKLEEIEGWPEPFASDLLDVEQERTRTTEPEIAPDLSARGSPEIANVDRPTGLGHMGDQEAQHAPESQDVPEDWLLNPLVSVHSGMLISVHGSGKTAASVGWHDGAYEGATGVVLSVLDTGIDNEAFPSTARVKFLKPLGPLDILVVPVALLWPVEPEEAGQEAVIMSGKHEGHVAKLLEEVEIGWFVSAAHRYFEIENGRLVRLMSVDE